MSVPASGSRTPTASSVPMRPVASTLAGWAGLTAIGFTAGWLTLELMSARTGLPLADSDIPISTRRVAGCVTALVGAALTMLVAWATSPRHSPASGVLAAGSTLLGVVALGSLRGSAWGFDGIYSDAGFRTQMVTRFTDSWALADYSYKGLAAYYPPLWPWLQGRAAAALDLPGWTIMKPTQIVVCLLLPVLSWLLWRRILPELMAAWVATTVALSTTLAHKPDEWLVLCLLLPWWLEVCRGARRVEVAAWGVIRHGVVLGLLLLTHTYFFAPLAIATALGAASDLVRRRPVQPRPARAAVIGGVGLLVAMPTWWHLAEARLAGLPGDDLQRRWSPIGFDGPALPLPYDARGVLELVGVIWLILLWRRSHLAAGLSWALVSSYVFMVGGQLAQPLGLAVLPEKSEELTEAVLAASGVLGLGALGRWWRARPSRGNKAQRRALTIATTTAVTTVGLGLAVTSLSRGLWGHAGPAQTMRYPDGGFPASGSAPADPNWHPWGVAPGTAQASVAEVQGAWRELTGRELNSDVVLVSARADVAATTPVHLFIPWKSIYSHPYGRFEARLQVLQELERCTEPACARALLRENDFEAVDGLVLNRGRDDYYLSVTVDTFPDAWVRRSISFDPSVFDTRAFDVVELRGSVVIRVLD